MSVDFALLLWFLGHCWTESTENSEAAREHNSESSRLRVCFCNSSSYQQIISKICSTVRLRPVTSFCASGTFWYFASRLDIDLIERGHLVGMLHVMAFCKTVHIRSMYISHNFQDGWILNIFNGQKMSRACFPTTSWNMFLPWPQR